MRAPIHLSLATLGVLLATATGAPAQRVYGDIGAGLNLGCGCGTTLTFQPSIGVRVSRRFETRLEALFAGLYRMDDALCPNSVPWQACSPPIRVRGLMGSAVVNLTTAARGARLYLIGGVGSYRFPFDPHYAEDAVGLSAGVGFAVLAGPGLRFVLEARHHYMMDARYWLPDLEPVVLRFQF